MRALTAQRRVCHTQLEGSTPFARSICSLLPDEQADDRA